MIVGFLFVFGTLFISAIIGAMADNHDLGIVLYCLIPLGVVLFGLWLEKQNKLKLGEEKRIENTPEEIERRAKRDEYLETISRIKETKHYWDNWKEYREAMEGLEKLDYEWAGNLLIDKRKLNKNK